MILERKERTQDDSIIDGNEDSLSDSVGFKDGFRNMIGRDDGLIDVNVTALGNTEGNAVLKDVLMLGLQLDVSIKILGFPECFIVDHSLNDNNG